MTPTEAIAVLDQATEQMQGTREACRAVDQALDTLRDALADREPE